MIRDPRRTWWCACASLLALLAHLALPAAHLLVRAQQDDGRIALAFCGESPAFVAKLRAAHPDWAAPLATKHEKTGERSCQDPSVFSGDLVVAAAVDHGNALPLAHVLVSARPDIASAEPTLHRPHARGPPSIPASNLQVPIG